MNVSYVSEICPSNHASTVGNGAGRTAGRASAALLAIIERTVADVFDIDCEVLRLPTRGQAQVALARQVAMYIAHVVCGLSLTEVGHIFQRDRTTASYACEVIEKRRDDPNFDAAIDLVELVIRVLIGPASAPAPGPGAGSRPVSDRH